MSSITQDNLKRFQQSLRRVSQKEGFYDSFYEHFMTQSDEIAKIFHTRDMAQLKQKLQETLQMVDDLVAGKPGVVLYLEMLGRIHTRLKVGQNHFEMWKDALISTVKSYDPEYDSQVLAAWMEAIEMVISVMYPEEDQIDLAASQ
ncbi:MAG: globin [Candidatus Thiodiazotropha sp. LLP2]